MNEKIKELENQALAGDGLAAYILGRSYFSGELGVKCNSEKAFYWYELGSKTKDNARCLYGLAVCYDDGEGIKQDKVNAKQLFEKTYPKIKQQADNDDMWSTFILGAYSYYGFGDIAENHGQAFALIKKAADMGHMAGCFDIGKFYHNGDGVEVNYEASKEYLEKAKSMGHGRANELLHEWYQFERKE